MNDISNNNLEQIDSSEPSKHKARKPFIAFLLSIFTAGLGQIYNGQPKKGVIFFFLMLVLPIMFGLTKATLHFYGLLALIVLLFVLEIIIIVDAVKNAKRQKEYIPKNYNTWQFHLLIAIIMLSMNWFFDTRSLLGIQTFRVPTTALNPTLQVGDWIVSNKKAYEKEQPKYGDIVVFNSPDGGIWTFRVIGLPNDKIELNENIVTINHKKNKVTLIKESTNNVYTVTELEEELPNGNSHRIYISNIPNPDIKKTTKEVIVPENNYYLLGDDRDNAYDSRYFGCVKTKDILGQIIYSYWGKSIDRINIDFRHK